MTFRAQFSHYSRLISVSVGLLILLSACGGSSPKQEVEQVLNKREQSLANKDLTAYMSIISPQYSDKGKSYQDIKKAAEQNFAAFSKIELITRKRAIYIENNQAGVVQEYILSFWISSKKESVKNKERLVLEKEADGWKIIKGL